MDWEEVGIAHRLRTGPTTLPRPLQYEGPVELNTDELTPGNFEKLVVALVELEQEATVAYQYGIPGQRQNGIDVIARLQDGNYRSYQAKRYKRFTLASLRKAVDVWDQGGRPYSSDSFVIVVACRARRREILDEIDSFIASRGIEIELWDRLTLSNKLRDLPSIVTQFFGVATARVFCPAFHAGDTQSASGSNHQLYADAAVRGPLRALDLSRSVAAAEEFLTGGRHEEAGALFESIASELRTAGFSFHSELIMQRAVDANLGGDATERAAEQVLNLYWSHRTQLTNPESLVRSLSRVHARASELSHHRLLAVKSALCVSALERGDATSLQEVLDAFEELEPLPELVVPLAILVEACMAYGDFAPTPALLAKLHSVLDLAVTEEPVFFFRLGACVAQLTGAWRPFLQRVREHMAPIYHAWGNARRACAEALTNDPGHAEECMTDAIEKACSLGASYDAANWLYALRTVRLWGGSVRAPGHDEHTMAKQLLNQETVSRMPGSDRIVLSANQALVRGPASRALPLINAWRVQAFVRGDLADRLQAEGALGRLYADNEALVEAIDSFVWCGRDREIKETAKRLPEQPAALEYKSTRWRTTQQLDSALVAAVAAADLIPDIAGRSWLDLAINLLQSDLSQLPPSMGSYPDINSFAVARSFGELLTDEEAAELLNQMSSWLDRPEHTYRHTDRDHIRLLAKLARRRGPLDKGVADQLIAAIGASHELASDVLSSESCVGHLQRATAADESLLGRLRNDNRDGVLATCLIATDQIDDAIVAFVNDHADRVINREAATASSSSRWGGDNEWNVLAPALNRDRADALAASYMNCASNAHEPMGNRNSALAALGDLAVSLSDQQRVVSYEAVRTLIDSRVEDRSISGMMAAASNPFSSFRFRDVARDLRGGAFYALVKLAEEPQQYEEVQRLAFFVVARAEESVAVQVVQALIAVPLEYRTFGVEPLRLFSSEPARSLLAVVWAEQQEDESLGRELAADSSPMVRRSLARAMAQSGTDSEVRDLLRTDCRRSVRTRAAGAGA